jgi:peptidoglycan lytic transglycosylase
MRFARILCVVSLAAFISGCRARQNYFPEAGADVQTGIASWYGPEFHGKSTSSKEIYDMNDLTAAHNTLPLGTHVVVTNLTNSRSVTVRINDRGPFAKNRVIDLSYAAAKALDMIGPGTAPVRIEVLRDISPPASSLTFSVQVGAFVSKDNAVRLSGELERSFAGVYMATFETAQQTYYRVRIKAATRQEAEAIAGSLLEKGYTGIIFEGE